ncbi:MAG: hypothetical protein VX278_24210 [Myxococcota bacterium]|nr:hypothetical protein [Myxococcota bacterium]
MKSHQKNDILYWFETPKRQRVVGAVLVVPASVLLLVLSFLQEKGSAATLFLAVVAFVCPFFYGKQYQRMEGVNRERESLFVWKGFFVLWPLPLIWRTEKGHFSFTYLQIKQQQQRETNASEKRHCVLFSGKTPKGKKTQWIFSHSFTNRDEARKHVQTLKAFCMKSK